MLIILSCPNAANDFLKNDHFIHLCWPKKKIVGMKKSQGEKFHVITKESGWKNVFSVILVKLCFYTPWQQIHSFIQFTFFHSFFPTPINFELEFQRRKINEKKQRGWGKCYPSPLLVRPSSLLVCRPLPPRNAFNCNDNTTAVFLTGEKPTEV